MVVARTWLVRSLLLLLLLLQVNNLREIQALRRLSPNPHIIKLYEVL